MRTGLADVTSSESPITNVVPVLPSSIALSNSSQFVPVQARRENPIVPATTHQLPSGNSNMFWSHGDSDSDTGRGSDPGSSTPPPWLLGSTWTPGTYMLLNARSNAAADLSGGDFKTVIGFQAHGQSNQQWEFCPKGNGYTIHSLRLPAGYLTVEGEAKEDAVVVAAERRTEWSVVPTSEGLRLFWPKQDLVCTLVADTESRLQMKLKTLDRGNQYQLWRFTRIGESQPRPATAIRVESDNLMLEHIIDTSPALPPTWILGRKILANAHNDLVADLSGQDDRSIIGFPHHGSKNQQWELIPTGNGYAIRCVKIPYYGGEEVYMSIEGEVREKAVVVARAHRTEWCVKQTTNGGDMRISWPNSNLVFQLADAAYQPQVLLRTLVPGDLRQLWSFIPIPSDEPHPAHQPLRTGALETTGAQATPDLTSQSTEVGAESTRAVSDSATTETVAVSKVDELITITRTTTTTTVVTEAIRIPRATLPSWAVGPLSSVLSTEPKD